MAAIQRTTKQQIFDAVQDLHNREQMVTREVLQMVTGIKLTIIDDRSHVERIRAWCKTWRGLAVALESKGV